MSKFAGLLLLPLAAFGQTIPNPGATVYQQHCAPCHDSGAPRIPTRAVLQQRTSTTILKALNVGVMKQQGAALSFSERLVVAGWLGRKTTVSINASRLTNICPSPGIHNATTASPSWTSWGGPGNLRFQPAHAAGLTGADAQHLKLKWAFAAPDVTYLRSQPAVYGGRVLFGAESIVYSLDTATGCTYWATETPTSVRSGITIGSPANTPLAFFGDQAGGVHALDVATGAPVWQIQADTHPATMVTGTPAYDQGRLYVPVSSFEELSALAPGYVCCTFRGSVLALDARTGKRLWQTFTIDKAPSVTHLTKGGAKSMGPSGAAIWSSPTIDAEKGILYVTTGDNYSDPPSGTSDAVLALSMETGKILWSKQLKKGDAFNVACTVPGGKGCPDANGPDFDFGSSAMLLRLPTGQRALVASQKSGAIYAIDPDQQGKLLWQSQVGKGGTLGGIEWGTASDGERLYVALSDETFLPSANATDPFPLDPNKGGGLFAFRPDNGERLWMTPPPPCDAHHPCSPAQPGAITAIPGAVFSGSLDGHLRAYSTATGKILWDYDTAHEYKTVNGVPGHGGSLNVAGPVIAGGTVYALSGYNQFGAAAGNVLLAFTVDGR